MREDGSHNFGCPFFVEKIKNKILSCFYENIKKKLNYAENPLRRFWYSSYFNDFVVHGGSSSLSGDRPYNVMKKCLL
jgi:hypothetical protein